jgi:hypothetical protein
MNDERNYGVTEARFALTLLTCLLLALGYIALHRLAGPAPVQDADAAPVVEVLKPSAGDAAPSEPQPQVLTIEPQGPAFRSLPPDSPVPPTRDGVAIRPSVTESETPESLPARR